MVRVAVQFVEPPIANVVAAQVTAERPASGSETETAVRLTLPVLTTANEKVCKSPKDALLGEMSVVNATDLVSESVLIWLIGVVVDELFDVTAAPNGGFPDANAVLVTTPALTSA